MKRTMITLVLFGMLAGISAAADGPSYFRKDQGAVGDGFALPEQFDAKEQLVWRQAVSPGISTPCVHDDLVVLTTWDKARKELATVALDRATGKQRWKKSVSVQRIEATHSAGSPAVSTPACDGKRFYVFFGSVGLFCYDLQGRVVWKK